MLVTDVLYEFIYEDYTEELFWSKVITFKNELLDGSDLLY